MEACSNMCIYPAPGSILRDKRTFILFLEIFFSTSFANASENTQIRTTDFVVCASEFDFTGLFLSSTPLREPQNCLPCSKCRHWVGRARCAAQLSCPPSNTPSLWTPPFVGVLFLLSLWLSRLRCLFCYDEGSDEQLQQPKHQQSVYHNGATLSAKATTSLLLVCSAWDSLDYRPFRVPLCLSTIDQRWRWSPNLNLNFFFPTYTQTHVHTHTHTHICMYIHI